MDPEVGGFEPTQLYHHLARMMTGPLLTQPREENDFQEAFYRPGSGSCVRASPDKAWSRRPLDPALLASQGWGRCAWNGQFALLTHRGDAEATLNYANAFALHLWAIDWEQMQVTPSRDTALEEDRALCVPISHERQVAQQGFAMAIAAGASAATAGCSRYGMP